MWHRRKILETIGVVSQIIHEDGYYNDLITSANHSYYRVDIRNPSANTTYLMNKSTLIQLRSKYLDFDQMEVQWLCFVDNQIRLVRRDLSNSTVVTSQMNPSIKLTTTSNRSPISAQRPIILNQTIDFNSALQFSNALIYSILPHDHEHIRSWHLKVRSPLWASSLELLPFSH